MVGRGGCVGVLVGVLVCGVLAVSFWGVSGHEVGVCCGVIGGYWCALCVLSHLCEWLS